MPKKTSAIAEFLSLSADDLRKEITTQRASIAKMRIGVALRSHKDTAAFSRAKKQLARMLTALRQNDTSKALKKKATTATVSAPKS